MAYDGWFTFDGVELVNLSRTVQLAQVLNVNTVWLRADSVAWIEDELADGTTYTDITDTPWYDIHYPASTEFAGIIPLGVSGLDDSSLESTPVEYITDGGHSGKPRNGTQSLVWNVSLIASTERGAEFGKRWLDRMLRGTGVFCSGVDLHYFRTPVAGSDVVHRRDVRLTRGTSVTRKRANACSATWTVTFTMTAANPYEYGEPIFTLSGLGGDEGDVLGQAPLTDDPEELAILEVGTTVIIENSCPVYDYTPIYDPLYPALVAPPAPPEFYPDGWNIYDGDTFERFWAKPASVQPGSLLVVPVLTLTTTEDARMVRFSVFPGDADTIEQCDPLWSVIVSYLPAGATFVVDGEQHVSYAVDDGLGTVRRTDSLVYAPGAKPVQWAAFNEPRNFMVALDIFTDSDGYEGGGNVRAALDLVPKSD